MRIRDEQKEALIKAEAVKMIVNEGFDGLSMQKLAKAAGVSPATIYIYFKNREDLLNQLFNEIQRTFSDYSLRNFDPQMSFRDGLWQQWQNRWSFIQKCPDYYLFMEQFRNSPLIHSDVIELSEFKENMKAFVKNAILRGEIQMMDPEVFWTVAYGSFYALIKFHLNGKTMMGREFKMTDELLKQVFDMMIKSFS